MAEHEMLLDLASEVRGALSRGDTSAARTIFAELTEILHPHVYAEEHGLFAVMRDLGEFSDHIDWLETEHADLEAKLAGPFSPGMALDVCDRLREHIHSEEYGLFPFALAGLGGEDWAAVSARETAS
ncbi:MAG: hemerythrin domain-containing protein [Micromonosporaceae bacterium]